MSIFIGVEGGALFVNKSICWNVTDLWSIKIEAIEHTKVKMSGKGRKPDRRMIAQRYKGIRQIEAILAKSESAKKGLCTGLKKGCRDGIWNWGSASDMFKVGRDMAWVTAAAPCPTLHCQLAWPGHATDTVKARFYARSVGRSGRAARPRDEYSKRTRPTRLSMPAITSFWKAKTYKPQMLQS